MCKASIKINTATFEDSAQFFVFDDSNHSMQTQTKLCAQDIKEILFGLKQ